jgi:hypothetical protein
MQQGADTEPSAGGRTPRFAAPPVDAVARLFPRLEILGLLGVGGMGAVYKARQPALDRLVALKLLPAAGDSGANFEERFNREARALALLGHPNIVAVHEFGDVGELRYFIMEFVDGANLRQLEQTGRLSPREALQIIPQICDALQYAHDEGVVHRDIKPENVLVDRKGRVKIADFGLAKIFGSDTESLRLTQEGQVMGTPHYMAPEQVERPLTVDHRADIYSLGVVFYEMLTGDLPLGKFSPPSRKVEVDVRLDEIVLRALENDPARRYQKASEVKSRVEGIADATKAPLPASEGGTGPATTSHRFLYFWGFPFVREAAGHRSLYWKGLLGGLAAAFGIITVPFGLLSFGTGHSIYGAIGVIGWRSVVVRLVVSLVYVASASWRTLRLPPGDRGSLPTLGTRWGVGNPRTIRRVGSVGLAFGFVGVIAALIAVSLLPVFPSRFYLSRRDENRPAIQDIASGTLIGDFTDGHALELVAVGDPESRPQAWWDSSGNVRKDAPWSVAEPPERQLEGMVTRDLLFRWTGNSVPRDVPMVRFPSEVRSMRSDVSILQNGEPTANSLPWRVQIPESMSSLTITAGRGRGPWITAVTSPPDRAIKWKGRAPASGPQWDLTLHEIAEVGGGAHAILLVKNPPDDWIFRVVAVDTNGVIHQNSGWGSGPKGIPVVPANDEIIRTAYFGRLSLRAIREFQIQVQPVESVVFSNVPMRAIPSNRSRMVDEMAVARSAPSGTLTASIPGVGSIELLGVTEDEVAGGHGWRPTGDSVGSEEIQVRGLNGSSGIQGRKLNFAFRASGQTARAGVVVVESEPAIRAAVGGEILTRGKEISNGWAVQGLFSPKTPTASLRIGFADKTWRTILSQSPHTNLTTDRRVPGDPVGTLRVGATQVGHNVNLSLILGPESYLSDDGSMNSALITPSPRERQWQLRAVVVDRSGTEHLASTVLGTTPGDAAPPEDVWNLEYENLELSEIQELRVQSRHVTWAEFRDVSLWPKEADRVAVRDSNTGALIAKIPGYGAIELLALGEPEADPHGWWTPDGAPIRTATFAVRDICPVRTNGVRVLDFVFQKRLENPQARNSLFEAPSAIEIGGGGQAYRDGKPIDGDWPVRLSWATNLQSGLLRIGVGLGSWQLLARFEPVSTSSSRFQPPGVPDFGITMHASADATEGMGATFLIARSFPEWGTRVLAVGPGGNTTEGTISLVSKTDSGRLVTYRFPGLKRVDVSQLQFEAQKIHWVQFPNLLLYPASPVAPPRHASFSDSIQLNLNGVLDLDSGRVASIPAGLSTEGGAPQLWRRDGGWDIHALKGTLGLTGTRIAYLDRPAWDSIQPERLRYSLAALGSTPETLQPPFPQLPVTVGFRTAAGTDGLLQILAYSTNGPGATIRFKKLSP